MRTAHITTVTVTMAVVMCNQSNHDLRGHRQHHHVLTVAQQPAHQWHHAHVHQQCAVGPNGGARSVVLPCCLAFFRALADTNGTNGTCSILILAGGSIAILFTTVVTNAATTVKAVVIGAAGVAAIAGVSGVSADPQFVWWHISPPPQPMGEPLAPLHDH
jgi:hypothetical protein